MKLKYAISHTIVHIVLALSIVIFFKLDFFGFLIVSIATILPDLDHIRLWLKHGIRGYLELRTGKELGKPRKYTSHKSYVLIFTAIFAAVFSYYDFLFVRVVFTAIALHLLWDLFEDVVIFKTGVKHWI